MSEKTNKTNKILVRHHIMYLIQDLKSVLFFCQILIIIFLVITIVSFNYQYWYFVKYFFLLVSFIFLLILHSLASIIFNIIFIRKRPLLDISCNTSNALLFISQSYIPWTPSFLSKAMSKTSCSSLKSEVSFNCARAVRAGSCFSFWQCTTSKIIRGYRAAEI